jgi:hypothetical protein
MMLPPIPCSISLYMDISRNVTLCSKVEEILCCTEAQIRNCFPDLAQIILFIYPSAYLCFHFGGRLKISFLLLCLTTFSQLQRLSSVEWKEGCGWWICKDIERNGHVPWNNSGGNIEKRKRSINLFSLCSVQFTVHNHQNISYFDANNFFSQYSFAKRS